jgi:thiol-disulfide isomerase/thioredoxin
VAPSGQAGPAARACVVARGILDSYRQQQGQQQKGPSPTTNNNNSSGGSKKPTSSADEIVSVVLEDGDETLSVDDTPCATDCVLDITTEEELEKILASAAAGGAGALVVVDWYKTDCPACRAMAPAYARLCRAASEAGAGVVFAKSNVYGDSEEGGDLELTPLARRYRVKSVPLFTFHRGGEVVESFATRDKARLQDAVARHSPPNTANWADE